MHGLEGGGAAEKLMRELWVGVVVVVVELGVCLFGFVWEGKGLGEVSTVVSAQR